MQTTDTQQVGRSQGRMSAESSASESMDKISISQTALETSRAVNGTGKGEETRERKQKESIIPDIDDCIQDVKDNIQKRSLSAKESSDVMS